MPRRGLASPYGTRNKLMRKVERKGGEGRGWRIPLYKAKNPSFLTVCTNISIGLSILPSPFLTK
jgi:hypothetical protein